MNRQSYQWLESLRKKPAPRRKPVNYLRAIEALARAKARSDSFSSREHHGTA